MADATAPNIGVAAALAVPSYRSTLGSASGAMLMKGEEGLPARRRGQPCRPTTAVLRVIPVPAELAGVYPQVLRAYRRKGLLSPTRTEGGTRRHSAVDIDRLPSASASSPASGLNLEGVRRAPARGELWCLSRKPNRLATSAGPDLRAMQRHLNRREDVKAFMQMPGSEQLPGR